MYSKLLNRFIVFFALANLTGCAFTQNNESAEMNASSTTQVNYDLASMLKTAEQPLEIPAKKKMTPKIIAGHCPPPKFILPKAESVPKISAIAPPTVIIRPNILIIIWSFI